MVSAYWETLSFELPDAGDAKPGWRRWIDTSLASPDDISRLQEAVIVAESHYTVQPRSVVVLARWLS
jgi:glycogen operon protein